jgi:uncharacterized protein YdhG (YjbR/CyaY superfamily)
LLDSSFARPDEVEEAEQGRRQANRPKHVRGAQMRRAPVTLDCSTTQGGASQMAERKRAQKATKKPKGFTAEERAAMRERAQELKAGADKTAGESAVLAKIAEMSELDRVMCNRIHAIVKASAPVLSPRLWYGMPAYAKDGKVVCFFQGAQKFKTRYATFGFSDKANLDHGAMWPSAFALKELTPTAEAKIAALVKKAVS